jgi:RNA polymerase sigma factor (sigma-70 family)
MIDDEQAMAQVQEGRVEMLAVLFERHHVRLYNFFLRLSGDRSLSEDLVQEVFLRILKYRRTFRGDSKFSTWMYQIGRNAHIDHLRSRRPEVSLDSAWEQEASPQPLPAQKAESEQQADLLARALERLPLRKRQSVKVQVHRALKDLRRHYLGLQGGNG